MQIMRFHADLRFGYAIRISHIFWGLIKDNNLGPLAICSLLCVLALHSCTPAKSQSAIWIFLELVSNIWCCDFTRSHPNLSCSLFAWLSQSPFKNNILLITFYLLKIISNWSHFIFLKILSNWSLFVFHDHNLASHDHSSSQITFVLNQFMTLMDLLIMFTCYQRHHFQ